MSERSSLISKLHTSQTTRTAYIFAKLGVLVPSQVRALRLKSGDMPFQKDLAHVANMQQSRISMLETPGGANVTLETLAKVAAAFKVGVVVKFVPFSEMLRWENQFSQDSFNPTRLDQDTAFLLPRPRVDASCMAPAPVAPATPAGNETTTELWTTPPVNQQQLQAERHVLRQGVA